MNCTELIPVRKLEFTNSSMNGRIGIHELNSLSTNRPSFAAASQVETLMRVTNERVV